LAWIRPAKPYDNRYVSVITTHDRKVTHWRDYWNPQEDLDSVGGIEPLIRSMNEGI
jgi:ketosteroid isomerase-like protein